LPRIKPAPSVGALGLIRAFRSDLLAAFSANYYTDLRVSFRQLGHRFICLNDPEDIDHVLNTHIHRYQPNVLAQRLLEPIVGRSLLLAEGDDWVRQHRRLTPFFQARHIERLIPAFHVAAANAMASWSAECETERNLLVDFRRLTLAIVARSLLSIEDEKGTSQLADFATQSESAGTLLQWQDYVALLFWSRIGQPSQRRENAARWRAWLAGLLDRRAPIDDFDEAGDMLDLLRAQRGGQGGGPLAREAIVDQVGTMFSAGFTTTALALFWTVLMLALFPTHQEALRGELCRDDSAAPPTWQSLRSSRAATAFLFEALRLYPPAYIIAREARLDDRIGDLRIPRGSAVIIAPWLVHRHAAHWQDPHRFDPARFLQGGRVATPRAWMPFGVGPRVCIGSAFATMEILVVLRQLLARYHVGLSGPIPRPVGRVTLVPDFQPLFTLTRL
jgi:cytochrome P450